MNKTLVSALVGFVSLGVCAQTPHLHIYRNDGKFTTAKVSDIERSLFYSTQWGDANDVMKLINQDGKTETINISAVDSTVIGTNIPEIRVKLLDYPDIKDLFKTDGFTKSTIYRATLSMDGNGHFDDIAETEVEFRGRGNSTWVMNKTPYRFKFSKKQSVCGLKKAKTFALIANYIDCTLMRNAVALKIADLLEMPYTNHSVPVNLYLNGNYRGSYMLTEKIGIGGGSVDIDESKGMLFEIDTNYDEDYKFRYSFKFNQQNKNLPVMVKDPDLADLAEDDLTGTFNADAYFNQWKSDITKMLDAVTQRKPDESLSDVLDLGSVADYVLVYLITANKEIVHPKSFYMFKREIGDVEKYHFGPVWDFDWAFTFDSGEGKIRYDQLLLTGDGKAGGNSFFTLLVKNSEVRRLIDSRWNLFYTQLWPQLKDYMDAYAAEIEPSAKTNGMIWPRDGRYKNESTFEFRQKYKTLRTWLENRVEWINVHKNHGLYQ